MKSNAHKKDQSVARRNKKWPVERLLEEKSAFFERVAECTCQVILKDRSDEKQLRALLDSEIAKEELRVRRSTWRVDKIRNEKAFWDQMRQELAAITSDQALAGVQYKRLLVSIIYHYLEEVMYSFSRFYYFIFFFICCILLLRFTTSIRNLSEWVMMRAIGKMQIFGCAESARKLSNIGTLLLLPTHASHIDPFTVGMAAKHVGISPMILGAGLNLFNARLFAPLLSKMGAYSIDRRKSGLIYLHTLFHFIKGATKFGCHSLMFPGGTRTRTGHVETKLKLGLLNAAITAQMELCQEKNKRSVSKKIFIIPIVVNYECVPDAPTLMREYCNKHVANRRSGTFFSTFSKTFRTIFRYIIRESGASVSFGRALDVAGNYVNENGQSICKDGTIIPVDDYFTQNGEIVSNKAQQHGYAQHLSQQILKEYRSNNTIFFNHIVAFVAFELLAKQHSDLNKEDLLQIKLDNAQINYETFKVAIEKVKIRIQELHAAQVLQSANLAQKTTKSSIFRAVNICGAYHETPTLLQKRKCADIFIKNVKQLYYYHNLLVGYGIEDIF